MMGSRGLKGGREYDTLTRMRRVIGRDRIAVRAAKRTFNKRKRREARAALRGV